jgi:hypothetical protein
MFLFKQINIPIILNKNLKYKVHISGEIRTVGVLEHDKRRQKPITEISQVHGRTELFAAP